MKNNLVWEKMISQMTPKIFEKDRIIYSRGDEAKYIHYLYKGKVKFFLADIYGKERIINILEKESLFGEPAAINKQPYFLSASSIEKSEIYCFTLQTIKKNLILNPEIYWDIFEEMSRKIQMTLINVISDNFLDKKSKILQIILTLSNQQTHELNITQDQLACMANLSRVTTNKIITELKREQIIETSRRQIRIIDNKKAFNLIFY